MTTATTEAPTSAYPNVCTWVQDDPDRGAWATSCGGMFSITDGTPGENGMRFCTYCGGVLVETPEARLGDGLFGQAAEQQRAKDAQDAQDADDARRRALWLAEQAQVAPAPIPMQPVPAAVDEQATIRLDDICALLAPISISAAGLAELGIVHSASDKAAKLYRTSDLQRIRDALVRHVMGALGSVA